MVFTGQWTPCFTFSPCLLRFQVWFRIHVLLSISGRYADTPFNNNDHVSMALLELVQYIIKWPVVIYPARNEKFRKAWLHKLIGHQSDIACAEIHKQPHELAFAQYAIANTLDSKTRIGRANFIPRNSPDSHVFYWGFILRRQNIKFLTYIKRKILWIYPQCRFWVK